MLVHLSDKCDPEVHSYLCMHHHGEITLLQSYYKLIPMSSFIIFTSSPFKASEYGQVIIPRLHKPTSLLNLIQNVLLTETGKFPSNIHFIRRMSRLENIC